MLGRPVGVAADVPSIQNSRRSVNLRALFSRRTRPVPARPSRRPRTVSSGPKRSIPERTIVPWRISAYSLSGARSPKIDSEELEVHTSIEVIGWLRSETIAPRYAGSSGRPVHLGGCPDTRKCLSHRRKLSGGATVGKPPVVIFRIAERATDGRRDHPGEPWLLPGWRTAALRRAAWALEGDHARRRPAPHRRDRADGAPRLVIRCGHKQSPDCSCPPMDQMIRPCRS